MEEKSEVEERVLSAARQLFFDQGVARTPLRAIAAEANTSESGVLRFFRDKYDLAQAVMDLCWEGVNRHIAEALHESAKRADDPRVCLLEVVRTILHHSAIEQDSTRFLVSHFNYTLSGHSGKDVPMDNHHRLRPYQKYRATIDKLCADVVAHNPDLTQKSISQPGLCHLVLSLVYGVTGGWYLSEQDPIVHGPPLPIDDALAILHKVIYSDC
ncbi:MAG: helix-turn-helix transcriptional regulator [Actinobacteria bacterium]|nr:helix-turn-helix transcriptional regulator [Actinomycetota bacterium]